MQHATVGRRYLSEAVLELFSAIFPLTGRSTLDHNDARRELAVGDVILVDPTRPRTVFRYSDLVRHIWLHLSRRKLASHLGFEPAGGLLDRRGVAGRLLFQLISEAVGGEGEPPDGAESHMRLKIYDLPGSRLFDVGAAHGASIMPPVRLGAGQH